MSRVIVSLVLVAFFALAACGREETATPPASEPTAAPPSVSAPVPFGIEKIELGNQIGADKRVLAAAESFAPRDTIYASIATDGQAEDVVLAARWSYQDGQTVAEATETVASAGPTVVEFHIAKPDGLPAGRYQLELSADGKPVARREFEVR